MRRWFQLAGMFAVVAFLTVLIADQWAVADPGPPPHVPDQVIVKFKSNATPSEKAAIKQDLRGQTLKRFSRINAELLSVEGLTVEEAVGRYKNHGKVKYIEPNYWIHAVHTLPDDPMFDQLWGMRNTGQTGGTPDADIDADEAWNLGTGSHSVVVGVIDTGVDYNHPDLAANMWTNPGEIDGNGIDDDGNGFIDDYRGWDFRFGDNDPMDDYGHGTHCSGTIGAVGNNGVGVAGVCWDVKICPIKWLDSGGWGTLDGAISSIEYATLVGCNLTSNSWGGLPYSAAMIEAIQDAYDADILFIASAGNDASNNDLYPIYPCTYDLGNIVSVAATDHNDNLAGFSCYGATTVDLGAPGVDVVSCLPGTNYGPASGTSMAGPHVAGAAALILSLYPGMPADLVKARLLDMADPIPALAGRCVSGGRLNAFMSIAEPDTLPPGGITDLAAFDPTSNSMHLSWTATGDDGGTGTAAYYQVRYSTSPITEVNFYDATRAGNEPDPQPSGSTEEMEVGGLDFSTTYYFAIKAYDEWGNGGPISNLATGTTLGAPDIAVSPASLSEDLLTGETSLQTLTLSNEAEGTLDFTVPGVQFVFAPTAVGEFVEVAKGEADPRTGDPVTLGSGGPDGFGYRWIDSDDPEGPVFSWVDITGIGTPIPLSGDDGNAGPFDIGFTFPFYDSDFDQFRICTNGFISFTSTSSDYANQPIPNPGAPENLLAPFWDDLYMPSARAYMHNDGWRLIIQYDNVPHLSGGGPYTFQTILYPSGMILFQYLSMGSPTNSATVGIQNATRDDGLQIAFNADYVHDGLAVQIAAVPQWLAVSPTSGRIVAGDFADLDVEFDATGLMGGDYDANIVIQSNDPDEETVLVPVTLHVTGAPDIAVGGEVVSVTSTRSFSASGASTDHSLNSSTPVGGPGVLTVEVDGDYGVSSEYATVIVEGLTLGTVGPLGWDCGSVSRDFALDVSQLEGFLADGVVQVTVQNTPAVDPICGSNRHTVVLSYSRPADLLDFGGLFVGLTDTIRITVQNVGTELLDVTSISTDEPEFSVTPSSVSLDPGESELLDVVFAPPAPALFTGTLSIASNDHDEPLIEISLSGEGLEPPIMAVSPDSLSEALLTGETSEQYLTISNSGGSDLEVDLFVRRAVDQALADVPPVEPLGEPASEDAVTCFEAPEGYVPTARRLTFEVLSTVDNPDVLIVQDLMPWGSVANQIVLEDNGLTYEMITSSQLGSTDLDPYRIVLLASDQPTSFYSNVTAQRSKLEDYLDRGGVLEAHCSWGWNGGDVSVLVLPGGMGESIYVSYSNTVLQPDHPLVAGLPNPIVEPSGLSGGHFVSVPVGAEEITADELGGPSLVTYRFGAGLVLASTQALEIGFDNNEAQGQILRNMVAYASSISGVTWLTVDPTSGSVMPLSSLDITAGFDATGMMGGDYFADIVIQSNDPENEIVAVPASLHVTGAPDIAVGGEVVSVTSTQTFSISGASTDHSLYSSTPVGGPGALTVEVAGDYGVSYEYATVIVEGVTLGTVGPLGWDCGTVSRDFALDVSQLEGFLADGVVEVTVQNTPDVDPICGDNRHTVVLSYPGPADLLDFGGLFVGLTDTIRIVVENVGTDLLDVTSISTDAPEFSVTPSSLSLDPRESELLDVVFTPPAPALFTGTLSIASNDHDEPLIEISLSGEGLEPPVIAISPGSLSEELYTGGTSEQYLTISNDGGSDLEVELFVRLALDEAVADVPPVEPLGEPVTEDSIVSSEAPAGYAAASRSLTFEVLGAADNPDVLIVQDLMPWGSTANQVVLEANGLTYEMITSSQLGSVDLDSYRIVLLASDQPTGFYINVTAQRSKLEAYLNHGGVLEAHSSGWGWNGGDASPLTLPGGMGVSMHMSDLNSVLQPDHPLVAGVPNPFYGTRASHGHFVGLPAGAQVITVDEAGEPSLVTYRYGAGLVLAGTQTFEFAFDRGQSAGQILSNMVAYAASILDLAWLTVDPTSGSVMPLSSLDITAGFDARGMGGGDYYASIAIESNDPANATVLVPASLHVIDAPDILVSGEAVSETSTQPYSVSGATTYHSLYSSTPVGGPGSLTVVIAGDYGASSEYATVTVEGVTLGKVGPVGTDCLPGAANFVLSVPQLEGFLEDGVVEVTVQNTPAVDTFCDENSHTVTLSYPGPADVLDFGEVYVGFSGTLGIAVRNVGTLSLNVTSISSDEPEFSASPSSLSLDPDNSETVSVIFAPTDEGVTSGTLTIFSNDPDEPEVTVAVTGTGLIPPEIVPVPDSLVAAVHPEFLRTKTLSICNNGGSDLTFNLVTARPASKKVLERPRRATQEIEEQSGAKDDPQPKGKPQLFGSGGPDAFGHTWIDSDEPTGPVFDWMDITSVGTQIPLSGDDHNRGPFPIGFDFRFYENTFDEFRICTNGFISFTSSSYSYSNSSLPNTSAPENLIALWWDDLNFGTVERAYYYNDGSRLIIEFYRVRRLGSSQRNTFEVILYPDGTIVLQYLEMLGALESATIGIQNATKDDGLQIVHNGAYMHDNLAIQISPPPWLSVSPTEGTVRAGECLDLEVTFDPTCMDLGEYHTRIPIASNDPYNPVIAVPMHMIIAEVVDAAYVDLDPNTLNLGASGNYATCYVELPTQYDAADIVVETVHPLLDTPVDPVRSSLGDHDRNGVEDLMVKFWRADFYEALAEGDSVPVTVIGEILNTSWFSGTDVIRVIRPHLANVTGTLFQGDERQLTWTPPDGYNVDYYSLCFSSDGGEVWDLVADGTVATSYTWTVPDVTSEECLLRVYAHDNQGIMGYDTTDELFAIGSGLLSSPKPELPRTFALFQNQPNPAVGTTAISFDLPREAVVTLRIFDATGALVRTLVNRPMGPGRHSAVWNGRDGRDREVRAGVYFYHFETEEFKASKKLLLLR